MITTLLRAAPAITLLKICEICVICGFFSFAYGLATTDR